MLMSPQYDLMIAISRLHNWSVTWQLQIAIDKCLFAPSQMLPIISNVLVERRGLCICNQTFANVDCVRDLGVVVDSRLKFDKRIAEIVHKAMS